MSDDHISGRWRPMSNDKADAVERGYRIAELEKQLATVTAERDRLLGQEIDRADCCMENEKRAAAAYEVLKDIEWANRDPEGFEYGTCPSCEMLGPPDAMGHYHECALDRVLKDPPDLYARLAAAMDALHYYASPSHYTELATGTEQICAIADGGELARDALKKISGGQP